MITRSTTMQCRARSNYLKYNIKIKYHLIKKGEGKCFLTNEVNLKEANLKMNNLLLSDLFNNGGWNVVLVINFQRLQEFHVSQHLLRRTPVIFHHSSRARGIRLSFGFEAFHDTYSFHDQLHCSRWVLQNVGTQCVSARQGVSKENSTYN